MERMLNRKTWNHAASNQFAASFEMWGMAEVKSTAGNVIISARDSISGIPAPNGYVWVKSYEINPPNGDGWVEV